MRGRLAWAALFGFLAVSLGGCAHKPAGFVGAPPVGEMGQTTVLIWSHGSRDEHLADRCPGVPLGLRALDGTRIGGRVLRIFRTCDSDLTSTKDFAAGTGTRKLEHRVLRLETLVESFQASGLRADQIVLAGQSCGAWAGLLLAARRPDLQIRQIAFAPACHGPLAHNRASAASGHPVGQGIIRDRAIYVREMQSARRIDALIYGFDGDRFAPPQDLAFLDHIPGVMRMTARTAHGHLGVWSADFVRGQNDRLYAYLGGASRQMAAIR